MHNQSTTPTISVIVPVYNAEKYLHRCIDSILAQTYTDFELLLIDDGSKDQSGEICDEYAQKDTRVHVFHQENGGVSSARNLGLDNAKGEWITFVDSDDWVVCFFLEELFKGSDTDLSICGFKIQGSDEIWQCQPKDCSLDKQGIINLFESVEYRSYYSTPWCKLYRRKIIDQNGIRFNEMLKNGEDSLFVMQYFAYTKSIKQNSNQLYFYSRDTAGASTKTKEKAQQFIYLVEEICKAATVVALELGIDSKKQLYGYFDWAYFEYINEISLYSTSNKEKRAMLNALYSSTVSTYISKDYYGIGVANRIIVHLIKYRQTNLIIILSWLLHLIGKR